MNDPTYADCVCLFPDGTQRRASVRYIRMMTPIEAIDALRHDHAAYVRPADVEAVQAMGWPARVVT